MDIIALLNKFIEEHKKPLTKNYNLDDAINEMLYIQDILKMKNLFLVLRDDIKLNIQGISIRNYKHLSTDTKLLSEIKKLSIKLISRYNKYFYKIENINYSQIIDKIETN
jgi:hypothetical protein